MSGWWVLVLERILDGEISGFLRQRSLMSTKKVTEDNGCLTTAQLCITREWLPSCGLSSPHSGLNRPPQTPNCRSVVTGENNGLLSLDDSNSILVVYGPGSSYLHNLPSRKPVCITKGIKDGGKRRPATMNEVLTKRCEGCYDDLSAMSQHSALSYPLATAHWIPTTGGGQEGRQ
ncbi:hypothetical protein J6590_047751 [Homalodisca vitripennis]|nr:hypothetical protein J6590_047751 [Homalodisca vitripennis]